MANGKSFEPEKKQPTLNAANSWQHTFTDLDKFDEDGTLINYTVEEEIIPGYTAKITGTASDGFTITNTYTGTTQVKVNKVWKGTHSAEVTVKLMQRIGTAPVTETGKTLVLSNANSWKGSFTDLPQYTDNAENTEIKYTVEEVKPDGYKAEITTNAVNDYTITNIPVRTIHVVKEWIGLDGKTVTVVIKNGNKKVGEKDLTEDNDWTVDFPDLPVYNDENERIIYTLEEHTDDHTFTTTITENADHTVFNLVTIKVTVPVTKKWEGPEQDQVIVELLANGEPTGDKLTLNAPNWHDAFTYLEAKKDGKDIVYTVREQAVPGYVSSISGDASGYTITNSITGSRDIKVTKEWVGTPGPHAVVHLVADGTVINTAVLNSANNWTYTFTGLPTYSHGTEIAYTITEDDMPGYVKKVTGTMAKGFTVKNREVRIPLTGDTSHLLAYVALMLLSANCLAVLICKLTKLLKKRH